MDNWNSYFYPGTQTLRNKLDIYDADQLLVAEYTLTQTRETLLKNHDVYIPQTFDFEHLKAIHHYLFQDVYEWAGCLRTVDIYKGHGCFASLTGFRPETYMNDVHTMVTSTPWKQLGTTAIAEKLATIFAYVNQAHPFREGNGRASKVFMLDVAAYAGMPLDYSRVDQITWNNASMLSGPDLYSYEPVPDSLYPIFVTILTPVSQRMLAQDDIKTAFNTKLEVIKQRNNTKTPVVKHDRKPGRLC
ncbi:Fic/DOC family protein [Actinotignum urinale]|uniref:protein adenylyltransferase n=1 Tax=Actinotignum urinale TaxID=190146 RepID=A0ABU5G895_9ACTO|nr:Fic family protein [Actinotignum urinale]MDY5133536.1 Fic family protein [Actinotignum urinale]MDY5160967.1 Fic family protein [Actinotignum urinale]